MKFTYYRQVKEVYLSRTDEYDSIDEEFEYEVDADKVREALAEILFDNHFDECKFTKENKKSVLSALERLIRDEDLQDSLEEGYYDALKEYFEDEAFSN